MPSIRPTCLLLPFDLVLVQSPREDTVALTVSSLGLTYSLGIVQVVLCVHSHCSHSFLNPVEGASRIRRSIIRH